MICISINYTTIWYIDFLKLNCSSSRQFCIFICSVESTLLSLHQNSIISQKYKIVQKSMNSKQITTHNGSIIYHTPLLRSRPFQMKGKFITGHWYFCHCFIVGWPTLCGQIPPLQTICHTKNSTKAPNSQNAPYMHHTAPYIPGHNNIFKYSWKRCLAHQCFEFSNLPCSFSKIARSLGVRCIFGLFFF